MLVGCVYNEMTVAPDVGGAPGTGGRLATGGNSTDVATGGYTSTGGDPGTGGHAATSGSAATGGVPNVGVGGTQGTGGTKTGSGGVAIGGVQTTGGASLITGGRSTFGSTTFVGTGGLLTTGGSNASGGRVTTGGAATTSGTASPNTGNTVTFSSSGKATGAMSGWAYVAMGTTDYLVDPTCGSSATTISGDKPCSSVVNWSSQGICISGTLPALPEAPSDTDYINNWGYQIGVNATDSGKGVLGQKFTDIAMIVTGTPLSGLRIFIHRAGDSEGVNYCAAMTSGAYVSLSSFNTKCWDSPPDGVAFPTSDVPNIDKIALQVSSSNVPVVVTNLCVTGIKFAQAAK
jgi:hypothetical protein